MDGVGADGGDVIVTHDTGAAGIVFPAVGAIGGSFVVVTVNGAAGVIPGVVTGISICGAPVTLGMTGGVGINEDLRWKVTNQTVVAVVAAGGVTVLTDRFLLSIVIQAGIGAVTELLTESQNVHAVLADFVVGGRNLGVGVAVRPVLTSGGVTVTGVTAGGKGGVGVVDVTADTVAAAVVAAIGVAALIKVVHIAGMTGLTNTSEVATAIAAAGAAVGKGGDGLAAWIGGHATDTGLDHAVVVGLTVRIVTGDTVEAGGAAATGGKVNRHGSGVTVVTEVVALTQGVVVETANGIEAVGVSQHATDVSAAFSVTIGASAVRIQPAGATMTDGVIRCAGAAWCGNTSNLS